MCETFRFVATHMAKRIRHESPAVRRKELAGATSPSTRTKPLKRCGCHAGLVRRHKTVATLSFWTGGRVVYCNGLLNRRGGIPPSAQGSNPCPSATVNGQPVAQSGRCTLPLPGGGYTAISEGGVTCSMFTAEAEAQSSNLCPGLERERETLPGVV